MMMRSREAVVDYMTPLGLAHLMGTDNHYGPAPWVSDLSRPEWNPVYYHRADADGIGFDRTATGSNALAQYAPSVGARFRDLKTAPENTLLWFHHLSWAYRMASGRTLWEELVITYGRGVARVREMRKTWSTLEPLIDAERFRETSDELAIQEQEAQWWRDASVAYFQSLSKRPLPAGEPPPPHPLTDYMASRSPLPPP
jgi:alpha-glucuronidase